MRIVIKMSFTVGSAFIRSFNLQPSITEHRKLFIKTRAITMSLVQKFQYYSKRKSFRYGVPFLVMMVGGSFALKEFTQLRYQFSKKLTIRPDELDKVGVKMKETGEVTLETEYEKVQQIDIEHWDNVRGPRPWEDQQQTVKN